MLFHNKDHKVKMDLKFKLEKGTMGFEEHVSKSWSSFHGTFYRRVTISRVTFESEIWCNENHQITIFFFLSHLCYLRNGDY